MSSNSKASVIILAAGNGTRMKSKLTKVLHKVAGREMINMVIDSTSKINPEEICLVVSNSNRDAIKQAVADAHPHINGLKDKLTFATQEEKNGTGGAVKVAIPQMRKESDYVIVLCGDVPLIRTETLEELENKIENKSRSDEDLSVVVLGFNTSDITQRYGRLMIDVNNHVERIVEFKDATEAERAVPLSNSGIIAVRRDILPDLLAEINDNNASNEYYLTDIVGIANRKGLKCGFIETTEEEVMGVNTKTHLATAEHIKQTRMRKKFMDDGVAMVDPEAVYFGFDTKIGQDVVIQPNVYFGKGVTVKDNVKIRAFCHFEECVVEEDTVIGPFARIRPGSIIKQGAKIGNFVEIKKSVIGEGTQVSHLSYIGDAEIGKNTNIGGGTITCNYDGFNKNKTIIGDNVFIGSNNTLVAPLEIADGALTAAGSVITENVAENDLAIERCEQKNLTGRAERYRKLKEARKNNK